MERTPNRRIFVVSDTDVVINFLRVGRLDLLRQHRNYCFMFTEHLRGSANLPGELTDTTQLSEVSAAIATGELEETELTAPAEISLFAILHDFLGRGEAAAIAVASARGWAVASDDRRARREIERRLGPNRLLTTPGILLSCIRNSVLTVAEADCIKDQLAACRFTMKFGSFGDLLEDPSE